MLRTVAVSSFAGLISLPCMKKALSKLKEDE